MSKTQVTQMAAFNCCKAGAGQLIRNEITGDEYKLAYRSSRGSGVGWIVNGEKQVSIFIPDNDLLSHFTQDQDR